MSVVTEEDYIEVPNTPHENDDLNKTESSIFLTANYINVTHQVVRAVLLLHFLFQFKFSKVFAILYSVFLFYHSYLIWNLESAIWSAVYFFINLVIFGSTLCNGGRRFPRELEQIYTKLFLPLRVSRSQFRKLLSCKRNIRTLQGGEVYAQEKQTRVDSLALLLSGKMVVSQNSRPLHIIHPNQFVDSPEYFGVSTDELFQVTITSLDTSKMLIWHRDKLRLTIMGDEFLRIIFDHILGRDVVRKLIQVSDGSFGKEKKSSCEYDPMISSEGEDAQYSFCKNWPLFSMHGPLEEFKHEALI